MSALAERPVGDQLDHAVGSICLDLQRLLSEAGTLTKAEDAAIMLVHLRDLIDLTKQVYEEYEVQLLSLMGEGRELHVERVGTFTARQKSEKVVWDHDGLFTQMICRGRDEVKRGDDGFPLEPPEEAVARMIKDCAGVGYWRTGALRAHGIKVSDYRDRVPGSFTVQLPPKNREERGF